MSRLIIHTRSENRARKHYAFQVLLQELLGLEWHIMPTEAPGHTLELPNGAVLVFDDHFEMLENPETAAGPGFWNAVLEAQPDSETLPDFFAAAFYLLNNLDLRRPHARDAHDRLPASASVPQQYGFLNRPVIHEWAEFLHLALARKGFQASMPKRAYRLSLSCDVDHPLLWWRRSDRLKTLLGALLKRGDVEEAAYWLRGPVFKAKDPYDVFDEWFELFERHHCRVQFNFMGERPRHSDCWYPLRHPFVRQLMQKIADRGHSIGFHPSYEAYEDQAIFNRELASLREVSPLEITAGRQHYLRFDGQRTWKMWAEAGLMEDSTLGFPEKEGFRNGMCVAFPVFDEAKGVVSTLWEKPLVAMDVTLAQYQQYTPEQALEKLSALRQQVQKYGGDFTLLWHNSSWNTPFWAPWKTVLWQFINS